MRWAGPLACFGGSAFVFVGLHGTADGAVFVLTGLDRLVGPSPEAQAALTWKLLAGLGLLWGAAVAWRGRRTSEPTRG